MKEKAKDQPVSAVERILIIRLGALGDLVLCLGAFASIRAKHPKAEIALLTAPPFESFARDIPWIDRVLIDPRPKATQPAAWWKLIRSVRAFGPSLVYDLQGKRRQTILYYALGKPAWSGAVKGCSYPRLWPPEPGMHYADFLAAQLKRAGVAFAGAPDLSWLTAPLDAFSLPEKMALLIPGCAPGRLYKRWPPESYAALAKKLAKEGLVSLAVGTKADAESIAAIRAIEPDVVDLSGQTTLKQLAELARRSAVVVGNDTGPTHLAAAIGAKTVALMSEKVDPHWSAPRGPHAVWLQGRPLSALSVEEVAAKIHSIAP